MSYNSVHRELGKWVNKPLDNLPRDMQRIATAYIPKWQILTPKEREARIVEVDRQRGVKSKLRYDRAVRVQRESRKDSAGIVSWFDATLEADHWASLADIAPLDAAMLLCRFNTNETSYDDARQTTTDELGPEHFVRLAQSLADIDKAEHKPRTLRDLHQTARGLGLTYHSWIDGYMEATAPPKVPEQNVIPASVALRASVLRHSTKARRDTLTPVIELAKTKCRNSLDTAEVWGALLVLAETKEAPLIGATEEGLQYLKGGTAEIFTRNSLGKRLARKGPANTAKAR